MSLKEYSADDGTALAEPTDVAPPITYKNVNLYTDPAQNVVVQLHLEQLLESPSNPRTTFDAGDLQQLADTIKDVGVMQAILVRPLKPGEHSKPVNVYEIVFGHRRYRAAKLAGVAQIPAIVRQLTPAQAAQLQAIENLHRKDLSPMEEARGYAHYIATHGVTKEQLAEHIGKSRTRVYNYLKLATLCDEGAAAMAEGKLLPEVATLVARVPAGKLQLKALAIALEREGYNEPKPFRKVRDQLLEHFSLDLQHDAIFPTDDATLLPDAGACTTCPQRSGNTPELYSDVIDHKHLWTWQGNYAKGSANICLDPDCFAAKKAAHLKRQAEAMEAKGKHVLAGNAAKNALSAGGDVKGAYIALKDVRKELKQIADSDPAKPKVITIQDPRTGKTVEAVKRADIKAFGVKVEDAAPKQQDLYAKLLLEHEKAEAKAAQETKAYIAVFMATRAAAALRARDAFDLRMVAHTTFAGVQFRERELLQHLYQTKNRDELGKRIDSMTAEQLTTLMLDCALITNVHQNGYYGSANKPGQLLAMANHYGVDAASIRKDILNRADDVSTQDLFGHAAQADADGDED